MKNNKKNEELQSRREFFKKAAKATLPVIGAIALMSIPTASKAISMGCSNDACTGTCMGTCKGTCESCSHGCAVSCMSGAR
ncbi:MAG: Cys-Xaa-Xaa-Xaa repeat radical SAM target protein [Prevotella sp.]|nr:Cys-Xaa-Xaa-Xaa repeat radical SAM target protein [Prevotella sp.]